MLTFCHHRVCSISDNHQVAASWLAAAVHLLTIQVQRSLQCLFKARAVTQRRDRSTSWTDLKPPHRPPTRTLLCPVRGSIPTLLFGVGRGRRLRTSEPGSERILDEVGLDLSAASSCVSEGFLLNDIWLFCWKLGNVRHQNFYFLRSQMCLLLRFRPVAQWCPIYTRSHSVWARTETRAVVQDWFHSLPWFM